MNNQPNPKAEEKDNSTFIKNSIASIKEECTAFVWTYKTVLYYENLSELNKYLEEIKIEKQLVELRVFNENEEYYFWRTGDGIFKYRHRSDKEISSDTFQTSTLKIRTSILKEMELATRNYYAEDFSGFIDSRFVTVG